MKRTFNFLPCMLAYACLSGCAPTTPNVVDSVTLVSGSKTLVLTKTDSAKSTSVALSCGCAFPVYIDGTGGDVNAIKFAFTDKSSDTTPSHQLQATLSPASTAPGTYSSWVALRAIHTEPGTLETLRDTVFATATVQ